MSKVYIHFTDGFEEIEALTPVDVLRRGGCDVVTVSVTGNLQVKSSRGVTVVTDRLFEEVSYADADMVVLPGGPGARKLDEHEGLKAKLLEVNQQGKWVTAICAAPMVLGHLGLLKGKRATCYPGTEPELKGANFTGNPVEVDGHIITGRGPGVSIQFSLALLSALKGKQKADEVQKQLVMA